MVAASVPELRAQVDRQVFACAEVVRGRALEAEARLGRKVEKALEGLERLEAEVARLGRTLAIFTLSASRWRLGAWLRRPRNRGKRPPSPLS